MSFAVTPCDLYPASNALGHQRLRPFFLMPTSCSIDELSGKTEAAAPTAQTVVSKEEINANSLLTHFSSSCLRE
jgi:hypothetical protein